MIDHGGDAPEMTEEHRALNQSWAAGDATRRDHGEDCAGCGRYLALPGIAAGRPALCHDCREREAKSRA